MEETTEITENSWSKPTPIDFSAEVETPAIAEEKAEEAPPAAEPVIDPRISELEARLAEAEAKASKAAFFENPEKVKELKEFWTKDYESMSERDLLFMKFKEEHPTFTESDFEGWRKLKYNGVDFDFDEEYASDEEKFNYKLMMSEAAGVRSQKLARQAELNRELESAPIQKAPEPQLTDAEIQEYQRSLYTGIDTFKPQIQLPEGLEVDFLKNDATFKEGLKAALAKPETYDHPYARLDEQGIPQVDTAAFAKAKYNDYIVENLPKILEAHKEKVMKELLIQQTGHLQNKTDRASIPTESGTGGWSRPKPISFQPQN